MSRPTRRTLRSQISLLLGMASACSLIIVIGVLISLSHDMGRVIEELEQEQQINETGNEISQRLMRNVSRAFASMDANRGELYPGFAEDCRKIRELIERHQLLGIDSDMRQAVEEIKAKHEDLESALLYISASRREEPESDLDERTTQVLDLAAELDRLVLGLSEQGAERIRSKLEGLRRWEEQAAGWTITGGFISVLAFSVIGLLYTRRVLSPLDELREAAAQVREGEFRVKVPESRIREINDLSSSFGRMTDALLEAEKRQLANRLESIGILAGGVAHDFNNFLMAIYGSLTMARREIDPGSPAAELLEEAETASLRAKSLTQQLLTFARGGKPVKRPASVARAVRQAVDFAQHGTAMNARFEIPDDLWPAEFDEGQVGQVFSNLAINAEQATPGGGRLSVVAENLVVEEHSGLPLAPGPYVRVSVRDEGTGIPADHRPKIFDPYFTTKRRGSGLGLAVAQSVVTSHGGLITVESQPGEGATFHVSLPATPGLVIDQAVGREHLRPRLEAKILVMDDERAVRKVTGMLLARLGCAWESAVNGEEALGHFDTATKAGRPFDAVICDLVVPNGMGGKELARRLRKRAPAVPLVAASGYTNDAVLANPAAHGFDDGLAKPFTIEELHRSLAGLLTP